MSFTIFVLCGVLIALQFPIVMSSPITALGFAVLITVSLGSVSAKVGTVLAPLPIFALILVSVFGSLSFSTPFFYHSLSYHFFLVTTHFHQPHRFCSFVVGKYENSFFFALHPL